MAKDAMVFCEACEKMTPQHMAQSVTVCLVCGYHNQIKERLDKKRR